MRAGTGTVLYWPELQVPKAAIAHLICTPNQSHLIKTPLWRPFQETVQGTVYDRKSLFSFCRHRNNILEKSQKPNQNQKFTETETEAF